MLNLVKKLYQNYFEFILWVNLAFFSIAGAVSGSQAGYGFFGFILGAIIGMLINVMAGGFIATFLSINRNIEELNNKTKNLTEEACINHNAGEPSN